MKYEIYDQFDLSISDTYKQMSIVYENLNDLKKSNTYLDLMTEIFELREFIEENSENTEQLSQLHNQLQTDVTAISNRLEQYLETKNLNKFLSDTNRLRYLIKVKKLQ